MPEPMPAGDSAYGQLSLPVHMVKFSRQCSGTVGEAMPTATSWNDDMGEIALPSRGRRRDKTVSHASAVITPADEPIVACFERLARLTALVRTAPDAAWKCIQDEFDARKNALERACLAAGPLEDLLVIRGMAFIGRIESRSAVQPSFATMLQAIWRSGMDSGVWSRLQRVCEKQ